MRVAHACLLAMLPGSLASAEPASLAPAFPRVELSWALRDAAGQALARRAGEPQRFALEDAAHAEVRLFLLWDLERLLAPSSERGYSILQRESVRRRAEVSSASLGAAALAAEAARRWRTAGGALEAALAELDRLEAIATSPEAP